MRGAFFAVGLALLLGLAVPVRAQAQDFGQVISPVLVVDRDRLYRDSDFGKNIAAELTQERATQEAETRRIEAELVAEELALTEARDSLTAEEFRSRADAFDEKVTALREERDAAQKQLVTRIEQAQITFIEQVTPILGQLMRDAGATILLDRRSVLLSANQIDITDRAIAAIDTALADQPAGNE